jgi:hypothetical protein
MVCLQGVKLRKYILQIYFRLLIRVIGGRVVTGPYFMMKESKSKHIPAGLGYILGLVFGLAIMTVFSVVIGLSFFGIMLGLSFSLSIGIAFECVFSAEKKLPLFQKILLSVSAILLIVSVVSLFLIDNNF